MDGSGTRRSPSDAGAAGTRLAAAEWSHEVGPFECFGRRWVVRTTDGELAAFVEESYRALRVQGENGRRALVHALLPPGDDGPGALTRGTEHLVTSTSHAALLGSLVWAINRHVIEGSTGRLLLHAAAAAVDGSVIVLPAPMESGKTTLVAGLLDRGFAYLTDEAVAVTPELTVEGFPKPLSIDQGSWAVLPHRRPATSPQLARFLADQWHVAPQHCAPVQRDGVPVLVIFPRYAAGPQMRYEPLSPATALRELLACTFVPRGERMPLEHIRRLARLAEQVPAARLVHGDLGRACDRIVAALTRLPRPVGVADRVAP